jgi:hypothetical protein
MPERIAKERCLAGLGSTRDENVEPTNDRGLEESGRSTSQSADPDQLVEMCGANHELSDVDG